MEKHENSQEFIARHKPDYTASGAVYSEESPEKIERVETDPTGPDPLLSDTEPKLIDNQIPGKVDTYHSDAVEWQGVHSKTVLDNFVASMADALGTSREKQEEISRSVYDAMVSFH